MFRSLLVTLTLFFLSGLFACVSSGPQLTDLQKQELQTRNFEIKKDIAFASAISALQDVGYVFEIANKDTGIITGESPVKDTTNHAANVFTALFAGYASKSASATKVSVFMEQIGKYTRIRITFLEKSTKRTGDKPIYDAKVYESIFQKIEDGIFLRQETQ